MARENKLQRFFPIFRGKQSRELWKTINRVKSNRSLEAIYEIGCHCQRLERVVESLEERIADLEKDR